MNLLPRRLIFLTHIAILLSFIYTHQNHYEFLLALLSHYLILTNDSACYHDHCAAPLNNEQHICQQEYCRTMKWTRMRHCYKCRCCVHKFDHHCVLLDICIGEFNHKHYMTLLVTLLWNTVVILVCFTREIKEEVGIDDQGREYFSGKYYLYAVSLMGVYFNAILTAYLLVHHLFFIAKNTTTWEFFKRDSITYFKNISASIRYPFDRGIVDNLKMLLGSDRERPVDWSIYLKTLTIF